MRKVSYFFLVVAAMACMLVSGCGGDDTTYIPIVKSNGKFLYVNNDTSTNNYVSAFAIKSDGTLEELADSPFATAGVGNDGGYYASNPIALAHSKKLLFAANKFDDTISVFSIDATTGSLTAVGVAVASGESLGSSGSLAVNDDESFLFVANDTSNSISVFAIASDGTLTAVAGSPFAIGTTADGITLNLVGSVLYVAAPDSNELVVLSIAVDGSLTPIAGSPFAYASANEITSFALASATLGISGAVGGEISSFTIDATGAPTLVETQVLGINAQCVTTARSGKLAILSGGMDTISIVKLASSGAMTLATGSPFTPSAPTSGYTVANPRGTHLYATEANQIEALNINTAGELTSLGTYTLTNPGLATGLVIY